MLNWKITKSDMGDDLHLGRLGNVPVASIIHDKYRELFELSVSLPAQTWREWHDRGDVIGTGRCEFKRLSAAKEKAKREVEKWIVRAGLRKK